MCVLCLYVCTAATPWFETLAAAPHVNDFVGAMLPAPGGAPASGGSGVPASGGGIGPAPGGVAAEPAVEPVEPRWRLNRVARRWDNLVRLVARRIYTLLPSRPPRVIMWHMCHRWGRVLVDADGHPDWRTVDHHYRTAWMRWRRVLARLLGVRSRYRAIDPWLRV